MYILNKIACYVHTVFTGPRSSCDSVFELQCYFFFQKEKVDKTGRFLFPKGDRPYGRPNFSWVLIFIYAAAIIFIFHPILFHFYAVTINRSKLKGIH